MQSRRGADGVEQFLQGDPFALRGARTFPVGAANVEVVPSNGIVVHHIAIHVQQLLGERGLSAVDQRGTQPLQDGCGAARGEPDRLDQVPTVDVEHAVQGGFDDVSRTPRRQVVVVAAHVEEPAVGVRGREPPSAAAGLNRSQHSDAVVAFHPVQAGLDPFDGCRVEVVGEGADHADMVGAAAPRLVSRW